jgi:hypothetical protein
MASSLLAAMHACIASLLAWLSTMSTMLEEAVLR